MTESRRSTLPWLLATPLLVLVVAAGTVHFVTRERWAEMEEWTERETRKWEARDFRRPALWGETLPGRAFERYDAANMRAEELLAKDHAHLHALLLRPEEVSAEVAAMVRTHWASVLADLRLGAHLEDARPSAAPTDGFAMFNNVNLIPAFRVIHAAVIEAHHLLRVDQGQEAVELLLDAATLGLDSVRSPGAFHTSMGLALLRQASAVAWTEACLAQLDAAALDALRIGLERLDARIPLALSSELDILAMAHGFHGAGKSQWTEEFSSWRSTWRWGLSSRWMEAEAVTSLASVLEDLRAQDPEPWPQRSARIEGHRLALRASRNPWVGDGHLLFHHERQRREMLAALRLLRVAVDVHSGRPPVPLPDPLGDGMLEVTESPGQVRVASAGISDGKRLERTVTRR